MYFESFSEFVAMGGHGAYIWSCYLIVFIALFIQFKLAKRMLTKNAKIIDSFYQREQVRAAKKGQKAQANTTQNQSENN
jgi:heme exporter protein D